MKEIEKISIVVHLSSSKARKIINKIKSNSTETLQKALIQKALQKFASVINMYNQTSQQLFQHIKKRDARILKIINSQHKPGGPGGPKEQRGLGDIEHAVQNYLVSEDLFSEDLDRTVSEMQDRCEQIRKLEQSVVEICQLYQDISILINTQGETLDIIEAHIHTAKNSTLSAGHELEQAEKTQKKNRKKTCCILFTVLIGIVLLILLLSIQK